MSQILPSFCINFLYLFKSFCCFFLLSFSLSVLPSLPPFVPAFFLLFLFTFYISCLHFFPFLHFSFFHLVNFVSLLVSFFCVLLFFLLFFGLAVFLFVCLAFCLSVLVPSLLPTAYHYIHYANHYGLVALKVMTLLFIHKIRDYRGGKCSFSSSSLRQLLWSGTNVLACKCQNKILLRLGHKTSFRSLYIHFWRHWMNYWECVIWNRRPWIYKKSEITVSAVEAYFRVLPHHPIRLYSCTTSYLCPARISVQILIILFYCGLTKSPNGYLDTTSKSNFSFQILIC